MDKMPALSKDDECTGFFPDFDGKTYRYEGMTVVAGYHLPKVIDGRLFVGSAPV